MRQAYNLLNAAMSVALAGLMGAALAERYWRQDAFLQGIVDMGLNTLSLLVRLVEGQIWHASMYVPGNK